VAALSKARADLVDVNSDVQQNGLQTYVTVRRDTAMRYGFAVNQIDNVLYDAFGQRAVSTIYNPFNQYFVVMEVAPTYWQYPAMLDRMYFSTAAGNPTGSQQTQAPGETITAVAAPGAVSASSAASSTINANNGSAEANAVTNSIVSFR